MGYLSDLAYWLAATPPLLAVQRHRIARGGITVFMYHDIGDDREDIDVWQIVRRSDFLRQVDYLRRYYDIVDLDTALQASHQPKGDKPLAVLTFDDGHRGNIEHLLPIVQSEALPVTLYIATGHVESGQPYWFDRMVNQLQSDRVINLDLRRFNMGQHRINDIRGPQNWAKIQKLLVAVKSLPADQCDPVANAILQQVPASSPAVMTPLTPAEVTELSRCSNIILGAHTDGHEVLTKLSLDAARQSIEESVSKLKAWTGRIPQHFAYPAGYNNTDLERLVEDMGFASAMGTEDGIWRPQHSRFCIPRIAVGRYDHLDKFKVNALRE